jgi:hypothetical protein
MSAAGAYIRGAEFQDRMFSFVNQRQGGSFCTTKLVIASSSMLTLR